MMEWKSGFCWGLIGSGLFCLLGWGISTPSSGTDFMGFVSLILIGVGAMVLIASRRSDPKENGP